jgi:hypothetical protein
MFTYVGSFRSDLMRLVITATPYAAGPDVFLPNAAAHAEKKVDISGDWVCAVFRFHLWSYPRASFAAATGIRLSLRPLFFRGWKMTEDSGAAHRENASVRVLLPDKFNRCASPGPRGANSPR